MFTCATDNAKNSLLIVQQYLLEDWPCGFCTCCRGAVENQMSYGMAWKSAHLAKPSISVAETVLCAMPCKKTVQYDTLTYCLYGPPEPSHSWKWGNIIGGQYKKLIRRWDSERELTLRRHCTRTKNVIDSCINSATDRFLQRRFTKFSEITQCNGHYAVQGHSRSPILVPVESSQPHIRY